MKLRYFYKINHKKEPIPGSNIRRKSKPGNSHQWLEIESPCCNPVEVPCTCGPRYFVQLDGAGKPIDGTLSKKTVFPRMEEGIRFYELPWKSVCCEFPGKTLIEGYGGDDICTGGTATFYVNSESIGIGSYLYQEDRLTPVSFNIFRDDATGIIYILENGIIVGIAEENCSQLIIAASFATNGDLTMTKIEFDDADIIYLSADNLPITSGGLGYFSTSNSSPGYKTVKVTITGSAINASVNINDSEGGYFSQLITAPGVYTFLNVYTTGPNELTAGVAISITTQDE